MGLLYLLQVRLRTVSVETINLYSIFITAEK